MKKLKKKRIGAFVWNHFTNDARVLRECTALAEAGYDVDLIAIDDPKDKNLKRFEEINGFNVIRVTRYPKYLIFTKKVLSFIKKNKISILPLAVVFAMGFAYFTILTLIIALYLFIIAFGKTRALLIKLHIILQMIIYGIKGNYDVYHSNDLNTLPQGYICSKVIRKRKLVYDSHEVQTSRTGYSGKVYYIEKFFVKRVDKMMMTTKTRADYTEDLYKISNIEVIHNYPFNTGDESINNKYDLYKILDIPKNEPILLYQGGIQQGRGLENIVQAIPYFKRGITVFIGDGKIKPKIKEMVSKLGVEDKVRFLDKVPVNELKYYTANAYLGFQVLNNVCFNHYSALSNKLFEYIMSDIPVVACNFPEIKRVVEGEKIGICIDSHDYKEIANAVNRILENKSLHEEFKKNCKKTKKKYNWDNEKLKFVNIYDDLLNETEINIIDDDISIGV